MQSADSANGAQSRAASYLSLKWHREEVLDIHMDDNNLHSCKIDMRVLGLSEFHVEN